MRRVIVLISLLATVLVTPASEAVVPVPAVRLTPVGLFQTPVALAARPGSTDLFVVEKVGTIRALRAGLVPDPVPVLDLTDEVSSGLEQGLLGLAFSPDGSKAYVNFTDVAGDTRVQEFAMSGGVADESTRRELLFVDDIYNNHNGGHMAFGPDGYLYIGLGDGGSAGDPNDNAQNKGSLFGKLLRIDPNPSGGDAYTIPASNPFASLAGARGEIWAWGLRNPWKFSFDRASGDLWIGDVGQGLWEEVDLQRGASAGGENYGWDRMEGMHPYEGASPPANDVLPIHEYPHASAACSITGGIVYRGAKIPSLQGTYVFGDWCDGKLRFLRESGGVVTSSGEMGLNVPQLSSFGEDNAGELYALSLGGLVLRFDPLLPV